MTDRALALRGDAPTEFPKEPSMFDLPEWTGVAADGEARATPRFAGVRFQRAGKVYHYSAEGLSSVKVGDWVIVDTARGRQMAQVATLNPPRDSNAGYKRVERLATGRDMATRHYYENKELEAMIACRAESAALRLPIKIARAEYSFDGQTLTILYSSDQEERVEVGALREAMSRLYRARVEFRQISPRELAKLLGGMGACGIEERCCSRFLTEFSPISIKHAKEQNLSLNPNDITGMCGRLRCCLVFEFEQYVEAKRHLPKVKSMIGTPKGEGKVIEVMPMQDTVLVKFGEGPESRIEQYHREQLIPLEEYKRLQEKALSGTCDKHEGGGCDCGRKDERGPAGRAPGGEEDRRLADKARGSDYQKQMEQRQRDREEKRAQLRKDMKQRQRDRVSQSSLGANTPQTSPGTHGGSPASPGQPEETDAGPTARPDSDEIGGAANPQTNPNRPPKRPLLRRR